MNNKFTILIAPEVQDDIIEIGKWYDKSKSKLGSKFLKELNICFSQLSLNPSYQIRYSNVRCLPLQTFPYNIHFVLEKEAKIVLVKAVLHTSRDVIKK